MNLGANRIEIVPISSLVPYIKNARTHSIDQIEQIAKSIKEFGFTNPILIDGEKGIIAGHGRLAAAKKLGFIEVPTIDLSYLTPAQKRAYILADNKLALNAGWDAEILQGELIGLDESDFDLGSIGFSDDELDALLEASDPEDVLVTEPPPTLRSQLEERGEASVERRESTEKSKEKSESEIDYSKKIQAPIYTPKGEKPTLEKCFDTSKTLKLLQEIGSAELSEVDRALLIAAASRHTVFDYEQIAEFYAHAEPNVQDLMEKSALVIIDFDKAIENGFVVLTKEIAGTYPSGENSEAVNEV